MIPIKKPHKCQNETVKCFIEALNQPFARYLLQIFSAKVPFTAAPRSGGRF